MFREFFVRFLAITLGIVFSSYLNNYISTKQRAKEAVVKQKEDSLNVVVCNQAVVAADVSANMNEYGKITITHKSGTTTHISPHLGCIVTK